MEDDRNESDLNLLACMVDWEIRDKNSGNIYNTFKSNVMSV